MPRAAIDIGSNSLLLLIRDDADRTVLDKMQVVGLGRGLGNGGNFRADRMEAALATLSDYADCARRAGVPPDQIRAVATSAARRAVNAGSFFDEVRRRTGIRIEVISGDEEARLTYCGALEGLVLPAARLSVVDIGGGSTEVVVPSTADEVMRRSLEIGSVRITEFWFGQTFERYDQAKIASMCNEIAQVVETLDWPIVPDYLVAVAGTATTLAAMELDLDAWDRDRVHGYQLTRAALGRWIERLTPSSSQQRRTWAHISPERADYLLAGACLLDAIAASATQGVLVVSDGGIRHGLLGLDATNKAN